MSDVMLFRPKAELDAAANLAGFVASCRNELTVFGEDLPFDMDVWDVTDSIQLTGHGNKRNRIVFSTLKSINEREPRPMAEPFLSFSKAYIRYMHGLRPTKSIGTRLTALKALEAALTEIGEWPNPSTTDTWALNRAAQLLAEKYTAGVAYRVGGQLEMVASFMAENRLLAVPVRWRSHIQRPGDAVRVGKEFDERRQSKMPTQAGLDALPKVFNLAKEPSHVIVSSVAALLCASPDRISEVLMLPNDCEVHQKNGRDGGEAYGLRWWPAKGADPMVKWIVPSMVSVVQEAIGKIRLVSEQARRVAKWYEEHSGEIYLERHLQSLRTCEWLSLGELSDLLGMVSGGSANAWCKGNSICVIRQSSGSRVRFSDVQTAVLGLLPKSFPFLNDESGLKYSDALLVARLNELHLQRGTNPCMIEPISINQINSGLGSRTEHGFSSVFSKLGFTEPDGSAIKITTHQFRHYLNTLAQAGGMSQLDIAKWSGRKDIRQNAAYDHVTPDQMLQKIRDAVGDGNQMFGPLAELPKTILIPRDEFARLKVPTAHTTDLGFCIHDYTMSPCQLHMDCIHCENLVCVKGDAERNQRLRLRLEEARNLLERAAQAVGEGYAGSDRWLTHHNSTVDRLSQLCSIMDDQKVPLGAVVQLSPPRSTPKVDEASKDLPTGTLSIQAGLLTDIIPPLGV